MNHNIFPIRLVYWTESNWYYTDTTDKKDTFECNLIREKLTDERCNDLQKPNNDYNYIVFKSESTNTDAMLIITKNYADYFKLLYPMLSVSIVEVDEYVNKNGKVIQTLTESEINNILRSIYAQKPKQVIISLVNSIRNNIHEQILKNILSVPGYKCILSSELCKN